MFIIHHRVGRIPVLPALAAVGALVVVGGIAVTTLAIVGIIACGTRLLRAIGLVSAGPPVSQNGDTIEDVVLSRSSTGMLDR
jgi:hypothetical protein